MHLATCRPGEAPPNDGYGQGGLPGWRWWEERKKGRRRGCGRHEIEKRRNRHARRHEMRYTFSVGRVPVPRKSGVVRCRRIKINQSMLTSLTLSTAKRQGGQ